MAKLLSITGVTAGREYDVGELCVIGRSPNSHVRLPDLSVSRQHAKITRVTDGFIIEDLDSSLGTSVNRKQITVSPLNHNDEISIATSSFRFIENKIARKSTREFTLVYDEREAHIVSIDASEFARFQPLQDELDTASIKKLTRRLNAMLAVGNAISSILEPAALLNAVLKHCLDVFPNADRALVAMPNRITQKLSVESIVLREGVSFGDLSLSSKVLAKVLNHGRAIAHNVGDINSAIGERSNPNVFGTSLIVAPLICRNKMLGLIYVDRIHPGPPFDPADLDVLTGMSTQVALALYSAQMHETLLHRSKTEQEIFAAHEVQKRFMPRGVPKLPGFTFVAHYDPCRDVGGDLYDFIPLDKNRIGIVIGDVSGKGFPAALVMAWVSSQVRTAAHQEKRPAAVISRVHENLLEARQDNLFVTLFYGIIDRWSMSVDFCNAGHLPPMIRRTHSNRVEMIEEGSNVAIGIVPKSDFQEARIFLKPGDTMLLVTDGVTEAMNPQNEMFGLHSLRQAIGSSGPMATDVVCGILSQLRGFVKEQHQYDDITIVAVGAASALDDARATIPPESAHLLTIQEGDLHDGQTDTSSDAETCCRTQD